MAIYTDRGLRRIGNLFLASLAIADLFVASLVMTFAGVNDILGKKYFKIEFDIINVNRVDVATKIKNWTKKSFVNQPISLERWNDDHTFLTQRHFTQEL